MPHIRISAFEPITLPQSIDGVSFHQIFKNDYESPDWLVLTSFENRDFFIWIKPTEGEYLIKAEKATRPAANFYIQHAIRSFAKLIGNEILDSNIPKQIKRHHLDEHDKALKNIDFFTNAFPSEKPIVIEVGFGSGRHLLYQAKAHPENLYIGIEIHKPSIEQVIKQIKIQALDNLILLNYDARIFLEFVPSNIVKQIFVHFPVPWDKKPSRRVISRFFIDEAVRVLDPEGTLELRTDSENYFNYALKTFLDVNKLDIRIKKNQDSVVSSKYEDRWIKQEKNIYDIYMLGLEHSPELRIKAEFSFEPKAIRHQNVKAHVGQTLKSTEGFIHFERLYAHNDQDYMIRMSLGNFEHPEHLYLRIQNDTASYFPNAPIPSSTNLAMHHIITEVLYG